MKKIEFISWDDFGVVVQDHKEDPALLTMKDYAIINGFDVKNRLGSAVKEVLTLAKLYEFEYIKTSRGYQFSSAILEAIFTTVIVSAHERDIILRGMSEGATFSEKHAAFEVVESLMIDSPMYLLE
ncbi:hypothetical protein AB4163_01625 [Vibrio splendidus]|uniref:hypothetical protein n=1 Tax=Vibrio TaxID=662 RepID=UPI000636576C|nr:MULTISPECIES: hypothetical protein [Vibrio]MBO7913611.1 hypothetical protein [Vibrio sp. G41H]MCF7492819.1 hypothetical protein [Vibrio sp. G-C-1]CDT53211.1 hypothetical protein VCR4J2_580244 [Vibrio coralliirubri]